MALLCLANTPLPAPWVQWLEREPERPPARLRTPYVAASGGPLLSGEFAPPAAAVAAAVSATGKAVGDALARMGFSEVGEVRIGKVIELELADGLDKAAAEARVREMCEQLLANTVVEKFEVELA